VGGSSLLKQFESGCVDRPAAEPGETVLTSRKALQRRLDRKVKLTFLHSCDLASFLATRLTHVSQSGHEEIEYHFHGPEGLV
jgi:hypothetical protein